PNRPLVQSAFSSPLDAADVAWIPDIAANPLRVESRPSPNGSGEIKTPIWIQPRSIGGTPMCGAIDRAGRIAAGWLQQYPDSFPPIVMNLTDGEANDGDPLPWAERLRGLSSRDGNVLLFNLHLSTLAAEPLLFPSSGANLPDEYARTLHEMSSELPEFMLEAARAQGSRVEAGARGFGFNADMRSVMTFLNVGTSVGKVLR
ncbi:MAG: VWA domain-containing protein, partial [Microthrixaceae bacterium]|nr:VWA domain-containing protein [Microthrixaceae bacterium]